MAKEEQLFQYMFTTLFLGDTQGVQTNKQRVSSSFIWNELENISFVWLQNEYYYHMQNNEDGAKSPLDCGAFFRNILQKFASTKTFFHSSKQSWNVKSKDQDTWSSSISHFEPVKHHRIHNILTIRLKF